MTSPIAAHQLPSLPLAPVRDRPPRRGLPANRFLARIRRALPITIPRTRTATTARMMPKPMASPSFRSPEAAPVGAPSAA
jgi:hypothetical protein